MAFVVSLMGFPLSEHSIPPPQRMLFRGPVADSPARSYAAIPVYHRLSNYSMTIHPRDQSPAIPLPASCDALESTAYCAYLRGVARHV
jgi:hypothetical protein